MAVLLKYYPSNWLSYNWAHHQDKYGITNGFEIYRGTHTSAVANLFQNHVLPLFSRNLCFQSNCQ